MISVQNAIKKVLDNSFLLNSEEVLLLDALGCSLAEDIHSPIAMPPFDQSAMDGYAISGEHEKYEVVSEIKAGDTETGKALKEGEAARIFTGAMLPEGATAIAKQEIVERNQETIVLKEAVSPGTSIRKKGEEISLDDIALSKGTMLNPAAIGLLSGLGIHKVKVYKKPRIAIVVTGNELTKPGEKLLPGKIYESNSTTLSAVLSYSGFNASVVTIKDDFSATKEKIGKAINANDLVIITGGISVGDYDFVGKALKALSVEEVFYKVNQKPGKPLFYGKKEGKKIFGLPGNPAAVLTCFYLYVLPAIKVMTGNPKPIIEKRTVALAHNFTKKGDRAHLLKARVNDNGVEVHSGQSSAMLSSFVEANCLLYLPPEVREVKKGSNVEVYMLPQV